MATWGDLEKDTGLGLLGIKEKLAALEAEHALCGGDRRRQLARIEELETQNTGLAAEKQELAGQVSGGAPCVFTVVLKFPLTERDRADD